MKTERLQNVEKIIGWALDKKAENVLHYDVEGKTDFTDSIIVCHGTADLHVKAIADFIISQASENGIKLYAKEGFQNSQWIILDFIDIIVHVFNEETREFYHLEDLYKRTPRNREKR
ncbi:MAG: ribosome silencing factor [Candidatus Cloacimonetes bacterium]|nr:ribosome silencing factor [Candidatus Cloacimonadota bacterium]MCF7813569.1 ribosome silencing factor [Candidatus Cloacimonadota bacterium]MCF7868200.1 ribosome silencing factor [Candidatus Cloacimonadota bacterium]MCF7883636.1 ribosome silencing factor [Candidatus Cloacimonadota bacterium]